MADIRGQTTHYFIKKWEVGNFKWSLAKTRLSSNIGILAAGERRPFAGKPNTTFILWKETSNTLRPPCWKDGPLSQVLIFMVAQVYISSYYKVMISKWQYRSFSYHKSREKLSFVSRRKLVPLWLYRCCNLSTLSMICRHFPASKCQENLFLLFLYGRKRSATECRIYHTCITAILLSSI